VSLWYELLLSSPEGVELPRDITQRRKKIIIESRPAGVGTVPKLFGRNDLQTLYQWENERKTWHPGHNFLFIVAINKKSRLGTLPLSRFCCEFLRRGEIGGPTPKPRRSTRSKGKNSFICWLRNYRDKKFDKKFRRVPESKQEPGRFVQSVMIIFLSFPVVA
jgi:hypothetical protein